MRRPTLFHRLIACLLVVTFGVLAVGQEPAYAGPGSWAKAAIEKIYDGVKVVFNKGKKWLLGKDDATLNAVMDLEGRKEVETMTKEGEKLLSLEERMTDQERRLNNLKKIAEAEDRHNDAVKNIKKDAERLGFKAEEEQVRAKEEATKWQGIMRALEADEKGTQDLFLRALKEPVPPGCSFLKGEIEKSKKRLGEAFDEYNGGIQLALINAGTAYVGYNQSWKVWGTIVLASVALIANIVTTLALIAELIAFVKGAYLLVKAILQNGWKALKLAGSALKAFFTKMYQFATDRKALMEFLTRTKEMLTKIFDSILERIETILKRVVGRLSGAWEQLKQGEFRKAWDELATLKDDVSEAQGLKAAADQAAAQGEQAAASAKSRAKEAFDKYDEATKESIDFSNNAHDVGESIKESKEKIDQAENKATEYAKTVLRAIDSITIQWEELTGYIHEAVKFRQEAQEAAKKYEEGKEITARAQHNLLREIEFLSSLLKKKCLNTAS